MIARSLLLFVAFADSFAQPQPAFDAATVKPIVPKDGAVSRTSYGEFMGSLQFLIRVAYGLEDYRISGGPKWLDSDKFDVVYKPVGPQANVMLRTLLADRFKLTFHTETRQLPVYTLTAAKGGPKVQQATPGDTSGASAGGGAIKGTMGMSQLVSYLSSILGRGVIDETQLKGPYVLSLKWTPDDRPAPASEGAPSLVTAIQEQLGLRLESAKGPVDVMVIDQAEKPLAN